MMREHPHRLPDILLLPSKSGLVHPRMKATGCWALKTEQQLLDVDDLLLAILQGCGDSISGAPPVTGRKGRLFTGGGPNADLADGVP